MWRVCKPDARRTASSTSAAFSTKRRLTTWLIVNSTNEVPMVPRQHRHQPDAHRVHVAHDEVENLLLERGRRMIRRSYNHRRHWAALAEFHGGYVRPVTRALLPCSREAGCQFLPGRMTATHWSPYLPLVISRQNLSASPPNFTHGTATVLGAQSLVARRVAFQSQSDFASGFENSRSGSRNDPSLAQVVKELREHLFGVDALVKSGPTCLDGAGDVVEARMENKVAELPAHDLFIRNGL